MPIDKDLKRLVRARMAATSVNYTTARAALVHATPSDQLGALVADLVDPARAQRAVATLRVQPANLLVPALIAGLESPRVAGAAQLLPIARRPRFHARVTGSPAASAG